MHGGDPKVRRRDTPLRVSGVGTGTQQCKHDHLLPVALVNRNTGQVNSGIFEAPAVVNSELPGLLGLNTMRKLRVLLDLGNLRMHICGPGDVEIEKALPPGTDSYDLTIAPSGHLLLPCSQFAGSTQKNVNATTRTLLAQAEEGHSNTISAVLDNIKKASSAHKAKDKKRPPPPARAPTLEGVRVTSPRAAPAKEATI